MERFLDLSKADDVVQRVLRDWLLRELRDDLVSRLTWQRPDLQPRMPGLRLRVDPGHPVEVYFLSPVGIGGKFFYEHPVGEAFYSAEAQVVVEYEQDHVRSHLAHGRLFWVGSDDPSGYRISEGFDDLLDRVLAALTSQGVSAPAPGASPPRRARRA